MSRIEKALEKATKIRKEKADKDIEIIEKKVSDKELLDTFKTEATVKIDNPYLITAIEPNSPISEEYRKLKSIVVKLTEMGNFHNTLMVTSTIGGEGKSITALNLAITLAQEYDHTVLLVDADLRQPSIDEYLGIKPEIGLSDCLANGTDISNTLIKTGIGKLVVLPAGSKVSDPVELLSSSKMRDLVRELKQRYADRYVIIDTPPILPFAEAHSIGSVVDGVIFVVREGYAPMSNIKEALHMLKNAKVFGIVYNNVEINRFDDYRYYKYYKSYYSKKDGKEGKDDGRKGLYGWLRSIKGKKHQKDS